MEKEEEMNIANGIESKLNNKGWFYIDGDKRTKITKEIVQKAKDKYGEDYAKHLGAMASETWIKQLKHKEPKRENKNDK